MTCTDKCMRLRSALAWPSSSLYRPYAWLIKPASGLRGGRCDFFLRAWPHCRRESCTTARHSFFFSIQGFFFPISGGLSKLRGALGRGSHYAWGGGLRVGRWAEILLLERRAPIRTFWFVAHFSPFMLHSSTCWVGRDHLSASWTQRFLVRWS
jgi:hypothetical protein